MITPQEKGDELINKFIQYTPADDELEYPYAVRCTIITVEEILALDKQDVYMDYTFWREVKQYLEKFI